ncbi:MAG: hypothetical protein Q4G30_00610 [Actinomycetaceae bacterium]|nr:hypothetical protein [Actinomycetaceae bacterium]
MTTSIASTEGVQTQETSRLDAGHIRVLAGRIFSVWYLVILFAITAVQVLFNGGARGIVDGSFVMEDVVTMIPSQLWFTTAIMVLVVTILYYTYYFPFALAAGVARSRVLGGMLLGTGMHAGVIGLLVVGIIAITGVNRFDGLSMPGTDLVSVLLIFATLLAWGFGGALAAIGFIRWHWVIGLLWLELATVLPIATLGLFFILRDNIAQTSAATLSEFWLGFTQWGIWLGLALVAMQLALLVWQTPRLSAPKPAAS